MRKNILFKLGLLPLSLALAMLVGSSALALPPTANAHAQQSAKPTVAASTSHNSSNKPAPGTNAGQANQSAVMGKLRACQNRQNAINNIITRIDTRANNQITLFGTIATRVENFYTSKGKTTPNYGQLVSAVNTAGNQAVAGLTTLKDNSSFSCTAAHPKAMVTAFQGYLKTEISNLRNYRTSVKNLIVGVASANGIKLSSTNSASTANGVQK